MEEEMIHLFEEVQMSKRNHKVLMKKLNQQYLQHYDVKKNPNPMNIFLNCVIDQTLLHVKSNTNIQRLIAFFGVAVASMEDALKTIVFSHLFNRLKSTLKHVRQRACQLIESFLTTVSESNEEIDCDLLSAVSQNLLIRLKDKVPTVRTAAVSAVKHLQDPLDKDDPVILGLIEVLRTETTVTVRNNIVKSLSLCDISKDILVLRLRDVSHEVRASVLNKFSEDTDIRQFSRAARMEIVQAILNDRQFTVRNIGEKLLLNWFKSLNYDVSKFLSYFGPIENEKVTLLTASWLAEKVFTDNTGIFDGIKIRTLNWKCSLVDISPADIVWTVVRSQYAEQFTSKFVAAQFHSEILPPLDHIQKLFRISNLRSLQESQLIQFNLKYLIQLIPLYDAQRVLRETSSNSENHETILILQELENLLKSAQSDYDTYQSFLDSVWRIEYVQKSNYVQNIVAQFLQKLLSLEAENNEERDDVSSRILLLIQSILQNKTYVREEMAEYFTFVLSCLQQPVAGLRAYATSCLAIFCIFDEEIRKQYIRVLKQVAVGQFEDELVQTQALKGLTDVCMVAGNEFTSEDRIEIDSALLKNMQKNEENVYDELSLLAMESAVKLVFSGFSKDPSLVAKLLQFFFVDAAECARDESADNIRMNQLLSIFLHSFLVTEESCFEIVRQSLSLFISDCVTAMKDEKMEPNSLGKILENLLGICGQVLIALQSSGKDNKIMKESYQLLGKTAFACLCRELLKLSNDKIDKSMRKDFIRLLHFIGVSWCRKDEVPTVMTVLEAIKTSSQLDKSSEKLIVALAASSKNSSAQEQNSFMSCAPALRELLQITSNYWEESTILGTKRARTMMKRVEAVVEESSEEDEVDSDDYSEAGSSVGEEGADENIIPIDRNSSTNPNETEDLYFEEN